MSLQPTQNYEVPDATVKIAYSAFPDGNIYIRLRDELGTIFKDEVFGDLYPQRGQPAEAPWRLALVTFMQFTENLTDRQAADAVRGRIDWKYVLGLDLTDPGFHYSVLSEFRSRLIQERAEYLLFETMLKLFKDRGFLKAGRRQRTDSTYILSAVRHLNRLEVVGQTLYHVLDLLAQIAPDWLKAQVEAEWYERYSQRFSNYRFPKSEAEKIALAELIGADGFHLLHRIYSEDAPPFLYKIPVVDTLRRVWLQNYYMESDVLHWRTEGNLPPAGQMIISPYDEEAHFSTRREMYWFGYKVHLTETCEQDTANLITHVETTSSTEQDNLALDKIHSALQNKRLLPDQHIVDAGYVSGENLVSSRKEYQVDLFGPIRSDNSWQAREKGAFDITQFQINWDNQTITCPMGKTSSNWGPGKGPRGKSTIQVQFRKKDCFVCEVRQQCTRSKTAARCLTLHPKEQQLAVQAARQRQLTQMFKHQYAVRSGIEGTIGQAADKLGMRRSRYRGLIKTHLHHVLTATAINLKRVQDWLAEICRSQTRFSHFALLASS
jgi:transposase